MGLALSLMMVPAIAAVYGVGVAHAMVTVFAAIGFVLLAACYQPHTSISKAVAHARLQRNSAFLIIIAAVAWSLYTVGYGMILGFGPSMLAERGWSIADAGSTTSIVIWLGACEWTADRRGHEPTCSSVGSGGSTDWLRTSVMSITDEHD